MTNIEKLHYFFLPPVNMQTIMIRELESDLYFIDKKDKYIPLDNFIKTKIRVAWNDKQKPT